MKWFKKFIVKLCVYLGALTVIFVFILNIRIYYGNNMFPSVRDGDLLISYKLQDPDIDDVVLYKHDGKILAGRIVAVENSEINISKDTFLVNNTNITSHAFYSTTPGSLTYPYIVPANSYFVINDYRSNLTDSRTFGAIQKDDICGVLIFDLRRRGF